MHEPLYDNLTRENFHKKWKKWAIIQAKELSESFSAIPKWNCDLNDWDCRNKLKASHPVALGVMIVTPYYLTFSLKNFLIHRNFFMFKSGFFAFLYHIHLFYYLAKFKRNAKLKN